MDATLRPAGFFALRTPVLAQGEVTAIGALGDRAQERERLRHLVGREDVLAAIAVASPDLHRAATRWLAASEPDLGVERALYRYVSRMAARATPFGLFATCAYGERGDRVDLGLDERPLRPRTRVDAGYLAELVRGLLSNPALRAQVPHRVNPTLREHAGRLRYVEVRVVDWRSTSHLMAIATSRALRRVLAAAEQPQLPAELAETIVAPGISPDRAAAYIDGLIDAQLLLPELRVTVTGEEPLAQLRRDLKSLPAASDAVAVLDEVAEALERMDEAPLGERARRTSEIATRLGELPAPLPMGRVLRVDAVRAGSPVTLPEEVLEDVRRGVELLLRLARRTEEPELSRLAAALHERHEGEAVPLLRALEEVPRPGRTLHAPIAAALEPHPERPTVPWGRREETLLVLIDRAMRAGALEVEPDEGELAALCPGEEDRAVPPTGLAAWATLVAEGPRALAEGRFRVVLERLRGPSGAEPFGRFCHAEPRFVEPLRVMLRAQEEREPGAFHAEIAHEADPSSANLNTRPLLRQYEIELLGRSGAPREAVIGAGELTLTAGEDTVELRSSRLGAPIRPRLATAHNFRVHGIEPYRLLGLLRDRDADFERRFDWGALTRAPFLPRVRVGRIVLSRARWRLSSAELLSLFSGDADTRSDALGALCARRCLPRHVALEEEDGTFLAVDLNGALARETLRSVLAGRSEATLVEVLPEPGGLVVTGPRGRHHHELVIPFTRGGAPPDAAAAVAEPGDLPPVRRIFPPGSEWRFARLGCAPEAADEVLVRLGPHLEALAGDGVSSWHFVRYADPEPHLRVRLHGDPEALRATVVPSLERAAGELLDEGLVWRFSWDTYRREVERYGGPAAIALAEEFFAADSAAALAVVAATRDPETRLRCALLGVARLTDDLWLGEGDRRELLAGLRRRFGAEHKLDAVARRRLAESLRRERGLVAAALDGEVPQQGIPAGLESVLNARSTRVAPVASALRRLEEEHRLTRPIREIAGPLVHMHCNRMIAAAARTHELVIYDHLLRGMDARRARRGGTG